MRQPMGPVTRAMSERIPQTSDPLLEREQAITRGVSILTGDPRKAVLKLSGPMIVAMLLMSIYNLVDAVWVAGLGADALAAVGFIMPLFMIFTGLGNGLGAGVSSAISRRIGAKDKPGADSAAMHGIVMSVIISIVLTGALIALAQPILLAIGAGATLDLTMEYGQIIFAGIIFFLFSNIGYGVLRAEGDTKRTMYAMAVSAVLNLVLDPIFIYAFGWGVAGAAIATVLSVALVCLVLLYWLFVRKDTYVSLSVRAFRYNRDVTADILRVGLPSSAEFLLMAILSGILNGILVIVAGSDAVAVYTAGWRVVFVAIIPAIAISTAVIPVAGAAYGARDYEKLSVTYTFALQVGLVISIAISAITWLFAPQISSIFTYTAGSAYLAPTIALFLRVMCFFYPAVPLGIMSSALFQATGRGMSSLALNLLREIIFIAVFAWIFAFYLGMGEYGAWLGIVAGNILGGIVSLVWVRLYIFRLRSAEQKTPGV